MAIADLTVRITSRIAFTDNTKEGFGVVYEDGQVKASSPNVKTAFAQLYYGGYLPKLNSVLLALGGVYRFSVASPSPLKTVSSATVVFSGTIARTDGSKDTWLADIDLKGGNIITNKSVFAEVLNDSATLAKLNTVLAALGFSVSAH